MGGRILRKSCAIVLQIAVVWVMRMGGANEGMLDSCTHNNK